MSILIESDKKICAHCGDVCSDHALIFGEKAFCCNGCHSVYSIINKHGLNEYYCLNTSPGLSLKSISQRDWSFVDTNDGENSSIIYKDNKIIKLVFYLPQIHCSSCLWLLENLNKLNPHILQSEVQFMEKLVYISVKADKIKVSEVATLLTSIGYEPHIDKMNAKPIRTDITMLDLGIVGFCFSNIMILSFPEYLGLSIQHEPTLNNYFRWISLILALPVFYISIKIFFNRAYTSLKHGFVNIDVPVSLAILVTFNRSVYEVYSGIGQGYFDSFAGIVFFMLIGRYLQFRANQSINFNKSINNLFPIKVRKKTIAGDESILLSDVQIDDVLIIKPNELVPIDSILSSESATIDYSFLTGESDYVPKNRADLLYTGGRVVDRIIEVVAIKKFSQSDFVQMWNQSKSENVELKSSWSDQISQYFSIVVLAIALITFSYWISIDNMPNAWNSLTAILIVACPCALLLSESFTYGFINQYLNKKGIFFKNVSLFDKIKMINHIVFDKTGTIACTQKESVKLLHSCWNREEKNIALNVLTHSNHPLVMAILDYENHLFKGSTLDHYKETVGKGIEAWYDNSYYKIGNAIFTDQMLLDNSHVYILKDNKVKALYIFDLEVKKEIVTELEQLNNFKVSVLSGDSIHKSQTIKDLLPEFVDVNLGFSPTRKTEFIHSSQSKGNNVMMIGDGLNDQGALQQADIGICISGQNFNFSPGSDIILQANRLRFLKKIIDAIVSSNRLVLFGFLYSILYNVIGLYFAVSGQLAPVISAILMPLSSLGIMTIAFLGAKYIDDKILKFD